MKMHFHKPNTNTTNTTLLPTTRDTYVNSDESPFETYANNASFALYLEPIRNTYLKTYQNIITLSAIPPGPLEQMVSRIHPPKLSEFQLTTTPHCMYALMRYPRGSRNNTIKNEHAYMGAGDLPAIYGYLKANGYSIDTRLTKMSFQSSIDIGINEHEYSGNRKLICMVDAPAVP
jgi:hypothetical protein